MNAGRIVLFPLVLVALLAGCGQVAEPEPEAAFKSPADERAARRAYDGAPPVIPHPDFGMTCTSCHNRQGIEIEEVGFAPPTPHELTQGMSALSRCRQCHVFTETATEFVANRFVGLRQDLRKGQRLNPLAPPTLPHKSFMRENCSACHTGPAAREEIRTPHPERARCRQCHVRVTTTATFNR
ncbi:MAG: hypothetical protein ACE5HB_09295 [Terriglobia bacterium]